MIGDPIAPRWKLALGALSIVVLVGVYFWFSHRQHRINPDDTTMPGWSQLQEGFARASTPQGHSGEIWLVEDSKATLGRLATGVGVGLALAIVLGFLMGCWSVAEGFFLPPLAILAKLNPIAMLAVFFVMAGTGTAMYVSMIAFGITPILAQNIYLAVRHDVPKELVHKAYTLGASHMEVAVHVIGHQVLPKLIDGVRLLIGPALVYLIAAEMIVGDIGFGYRIKIESRLVHMHVVYPYVGLLALFGYGVDRGLQFLLAKACPWHEGQHREEHGKGGPLQRALAFFRGAR